jgi:surfeit locus 1 family protein
MTKRRKWPRVVASICGLLFFIGFVLLGNWQLERRLWKLDLIQRTNDRVHAAAEAAPSIERWSTISKASDEYRRVSLQGNFLSNNTLVVAATELGSGYWTLTPFQRDDGSIVFVNRGFIGQGIEPSPPPTNKLQLTGLLRLSEPKGSVLRDNSPATNRWYSRDIAAIAAAQGISAAPYFIDAAAGEPGSPGNEGPTGGLTVISFHNSHLIYALTWYGLAIMVVGAAGIVVREERRRSK